MEVYLFQSFGKAKRKKNYLNIKFQIFASQNYVSCLEKETGNLKWYNEANALGYNKIAAADGDIFMKNNDGMIQRRNGETGKLVWERYLEYINQLIIVKDKLFAIGSGFLIINIESGDLLHSYESPYVEEFPQNYFSYYASTLMGYYDTDLKRYHIYFNIEDNRFIIN